MSCSSAKAIIMASKFLHFFLGMILLGALAGCGGNDSEADRWVTVRINPPNPNGGASDAFWGIDRMVIHDLRAREVEYKDLICGAIRNDFNPFAVTSDAFQPSRVYHFLVTAEAASKLIETEKYLAREDYDSSLPFTAIRCSLFGLLPRS